MRFILNKKSEFINLLLMIQFYIPCEDEGGYERKFQIKTQDRTLSKNNNPGLVFIKKSRTPVSMNLFFF